MAALDRAWRDGASFAEIDVRITKDGHVVLLHDSTLDRTTNGSGLVMDRTLAELKQLDAGGWFDPQFTGARIPTLAEVVEWSRGRLGLLIELKNYPFPDLPLLERTMEVIETCGAQEYVVCSGFDHVMLADLHRMRPEWPLEVIFGERLVDPLHAARAAGAALVSLEPEFCYEADIRKLHSGGVAVLTTLREPERAAELRSWGLDVFQSDDVAMVATALGVPRGPDPNNSP
jgi:glycerophosphoryl diester phosphodiesterase